LDVEGDQRESSVRLAEFVAAFSLATDLGLGQPRDHVLRSWLIAGRVGERLGLEAGGRESLYYVVTLAWVGCVAETPVVAARVEPLADRISARYRFLLHQQEGWEVIEQQMYLDVDEQGRVTAIDLLCSGFRPTEGPEAVRSPGAHQFDAGTMGCADGLAQEFRRRILAIPLGDVLVVQTSDPAAKEDLPPLARMMGHTVHSVEPSRNGRLRITVEGGR
jgi:TusA-related sulfurtransferase